MDRRHIYVSTYEHSVNKDSDCSMVKHFYHIFNSCWTQHQHYILEKFGTHSNACPHLSLRIPLPELYKYLESKEKDRWKFGSQVLSRFSP